MKKWKQFLCAVLSVTMLLTVVAPTAFAAVEDTGFSDVAADAWYADAVTYVRDNGFMSGINAATFSPDTVTTRAMLATVLYRADGSPEVITTVGFSDVPSDAYYAEAVDWAAENGIISGYGSGIFGPNDPVTREQIATILWRYAGSPNADEGQNFTDEGSISAYAADAVDWARANGIIHGVEGNRFLPQGNVTRAQVATILSNYIALEQNEGQLPGSSQVLVVYFSGSGNTETVAEAIAGTLNADVFELVPAEPYTDMDLDWTDENSRINREHEDEALRDVELAEDTAPNWESYDTVFIGYPIWWGIAAWPVNSFIRANDFTGKTVIPFCTSSSSGLGQSAELLEELAGTGTWLEGHRFSERPTQSDVASWVSSLELSASTDSSANP